MKTLLVAALALVPGWAWADAETNAAAPSPVPAVASPLEGLTPEQQKLAAPILAAETKARKAIEDNKALSPMDKEVQISLLHRSTLYQIQALKTAPPASAHP